VLEHVLDEIDAPARTVELVSEQLIGRARRRAKPAMDTLPENRLGFIAFACVPDEIGELCLQSVS
jgi:hypothetical protein